MPHDVMTLNPPLLRRAWDRPFAITLSDTNSTKNLLQNGRPFRFLQNVGTAGLVMIAWLPDDTQVDFWMNVGVLYEGGHWSNARITGTAAGVVLRGFRGDESYSP